MDLFGPYLQDAYIQPLCEFCGETVHIRESVAAMEASVSNLITNTVKTFRHPGLSLGERKLVVRTTAMDGPDVHYGLG